MQSQSRSIITIIVSWDKSCIYGFLLSAQRTSCSKARGSPWSSPLRSDGSRDDQSGEAGPVEQSSAEAKSLKTKGQRTVRLPLKWARAEAAREGASGPNKRASLMTYLLKERELKAALHWSTRRVKGSPPKKEHHGWKERTLTIGSRSCCCRR